MRRVHQIIPFVHGSLTRNEGWRLIAHCSQRHHHRINTGLTHETNYEALLLRSRARLVDPCWVRYRITSPILLCFFFFFFYPPSNPPPHWGTLGEYIHFQGLKDRTKNRAFIESHLNPTNKNKTKREQYLVKNKYKHPQHQELMLMYIFEAYLYNYN